MHPQVHIRIKQTLGLDVCTQNWVELQLFYHGTRDMHENSYLFDAHRWSNACKFPTFYPVFMNSDLSSSSTSLAAACPLRAELIARENARLERRMKHFKRKLSWTWAFLLHIKLPPPLSIMHLLFSLLRTRLPISPHSYLLIVVVRMHTLLYLEWKIRRILFTSFSSEAELFVACAIFSFFKSIILLAMCFLSITHIFVLYSCTLSLTNRIGTAALSVGGIYSETRTYLLIPTMIMMQCHSAIIVSRML